MQNMYDYIRHCSTNRTLKSSLFLPILLLPALENFIYHVLDTIC